MRTQKQIDASRANGAKSKGPVTPEGKARSSRNATTHGLFSTAILLKGESEEAWNGLCAGLLRRFDPLDDVERSVVYEMAATTWRRERAEVIEASLLDMELDIVTATEPSAQSGRGRLRKVAVAYEKAIARGKSLSGIQTEIMRLSRQQDRLLTRLLKLQQNRPDPMPDPIPDPIPQPEQEPEPESTETQNPENEPEIAEMPVRQRYSEPPPFFWPSSGSEVKPCTTK